MRFQVPGSGSSSGSRSGSSWLHVSVVALFAVASLHAQGQVTFDRLVRASQEPHNWLSYSGSYFSQRYTELAQITPDNVKNLESAWIYQLTSLPLNSTFDAVVITPAQVRSLILNSQRIVPVAGSMARTAP